MLNKLTLLFFIFNLLQYKSSKIDKNILNFNTLKAKSINQINYLNILNKCEDLILTVIGPAGSGKTFLACANAINKLKYNKINKIVITRPAISVDEDLGFLPGNIEKKMYPWTKPIFDVFLKYCSKNEINNMLSNNIIEISPLCFMRGRTFDDSFIIADEMQNSTPNQMLMLLTRMGKNSKMVITGDLEQSDKIDDNGLKDYVNKLKNKNINEKLYLIEMNNSDIQRSELVNLVLNIYNDSIIKLPEKFIIKSKKSVTINKQEILTVNSVANSIAKSGSNSIANSGSNLTANSVANYVANSKTNLTSNSSKNSNPNIDNKFSDCALISLNDYDKLKKFNIHP